MERRKTGNAGWLPALGFLMAVSLGFLSWFFAGPAPGIDSEQTFGLIRWTADNIADFSGREFDPLVMRLIFSAAIFVVLGSILLVLVTAALPKRRQTALVSERSLKKERDAEHERKRAKKAQAQRIARMNRETTRRDSSK